MIKSDIKAIERYWHATTRLGQFINDDIKIHATKKLLHDLSENVENVDVYKRWLKTACDHKDGNELEYVLAIGYALQLFNENTIEVLKPYLTEDTPLGISSLCPITKSKVFSGKTVSTINFAKLSALFESTAVFILFSLQNSISLITPS